MTNGEFYNDKINEIDSKEEIIAIYNNKPVECTTEAKCCDCFRGVKSKIHNLYRCSDLKFVEWCNSEYVPPKPKLTKYEKAVLSLLEKGFMARDADRRLYFYEDIPRRMRDEWCSNGGACKRIGADITEKAKFQFIKWEDEPISVEEMMNWEVEE